MNPIFALLFFVVFTFFIVSVIRSSKRRRLIKSLKENWAKPKAVAHFRFDLIKRYFNNTANKTLAFHVISDKVCADLDLDEVFRCIDRTTSKIGQQYLYFKLRAIAPLAQLSAFEKKVTLMEQDAAVRFNIQLLLSRLGGKDAYHLESLIHDPVLAKPKRWGLIKFLAVAPLLIVLGAVFLRPLILLLVPVFAVNMMLHFRNKSNIEYYMDGVSQLNNCVAIARKIVSFSKLKPMYTDLNFLHVLGRLKFRSLFISVDKTLGNEFTMLFLYLIDLLKALFNIEYLMFYSFIGRIVEEKASIDQLFCLIGEVDAAISVAALRASEGLWCRPVFTTDKYIDVQRLRHPLIADCKANSFTLYNKSMLLTGSNMAGKTTFIRALAINSILAQTLHFCFAESFVTPYFKQFTSIRLTDNLLEQTSYFLEEVFSVKQLIDATEEDAPCLFVLDEIFKGTNTIERISGGKAILSYLNRKHHMVFVATHDVELTHLLEEDAYLLYHFSETIQDGRLQFDHTLKPGRLTTRNAINILELYGYPNEIIKDAHAVELKTFGT